MRKEVSISTSRQHYAALVCALSGLIMVSGTIAFAEGGQAGGKQETPGSGEAAGGMPRVAVTREQVERFGIKLAVAEEDNVPKLIRIPGEVRLNADRVVHVVPRVSGIVRETMAALGDTVEKNALLAWIESAELAEAKLDFYAKVSEVTCCEIELPRAKSIYENVDKLIALLKPETEPDEEAVAKLDGLEMGAYRGQLLAAHATYWAAQTVRDRELQLRAKQISSEQDLLTAQTELKRAKALFLAALDTARYETLRAYTEAARERQVALFEAAAAEKALRLKGADDALIASLQALVPQVAGSSPHACTNPDCTDCEEDTPASVSDALSKDERFAWYAMRAPFRGTIIEKHIARGESLDASSEVFTVADLSTVWVDLAVSQDAIPVVQEGQQVTIQFAGGTSTEARIGLVAPTIDPETRTALARAEIKNESGTFRPGTFVEATISVPGTRESIVIPAASIQLIHDHPCVFVWASGAFELREVLTGATDGSRVEVVRGLAAGDKVAAVNAFHLKAEFIKSTKGDMGSGHGHAH